MLIQIDLAEPIRWHREQSLGLSFDFVIITQAIQAQHARGKLAHRRLRIVRLMKHLGVVEQRLTTLLKLQRAQMIRNEKPEPAMQIVQRERRLREFTGPVLNLLEIARTNRAI